MVTSLNAHDRTGLRWICQAFLPARRCASAATSCRRVSVCLSITCWYCIETAARIELIFCIQASLDL